MLAASRMAGRCVLFQLFVDMIYLEEEDEEGGEGGEAKREVSGAEYNSPLHLTTTHTHAGGDGGGGRWVKL